MSKVPATYCVSQVVPQFVCSGVILASHASIKFHKQNLTLSISQQDMALYDGSTRYSAQSAFPRHQDQEPAESGITADARGPLCALRASRCGGRSVGVLPVDDREWQTRTPSARLLEIIADIFQKDPNWFYDESLDEEAIDTAPEAAVSGMPLEPGFLFSEVAAAACHSGIAGADRHNRDGSLPTS